MHSTRSARLLARRDGAGVDARDAHAALVLVVVDVGDEELEGGIGVDEGRRDLARDGLEQRLQRLLQLRRGARLRAAATCLSRFALSLSGTMQQSAHCVDSFEAAHAYRAHENAQ